MLYHRYKQYSTYKELENVGLENLTTCFITHILQYSTL